MLSVPNREVSLVQGLIVFCSGTEGVNIEVYLIQGLIVF